MPEIRNLTEARERIAALEAQHADLKARAEAAGSLQAQLTNATAQLATLRTQLDDRATEAATLSAGLAEARQQLQTAQAAEQASQATLAAANEQIATLQAGARTVETRAREMLAAQGGKPLSIAETQGDALTLEDVRGAMAQERPDPVGPACRQGQTTPHEKLIYA